MYVIELIEPSGEKYTYEFDRKAKEVFNRDQLKTLSDDEIRKHVWCVVLCLHWLSLGRMDYPTRVRGEARSDLDKLLRVIVSSEVRELERRQRKAPRFSLALESGSYLAVYHEAQQFLDGYFERMFPSRKG